MKEKSKCLCPFCLKTIFYEEPVCRPCGIEFVICSCGELVPRTKETCPQCGKKLSGGTLNPKEYLGSPTSR